MRERHQARPGPRQAVVDRVVVRRIHRSDRRQRAVVLRNVQAEFRDVGVGVGRGIDIRSADVHGVEKTLRVVQHVLGGGELGQGVGVCRREHQPAAALDHDLAQPQGHIGHAVLRFHLGDRIVIVRTGYARERRVETCAVWAADDFLQDHGHLLFLGVVRGGFEVVQRPTKKHRCVDQLDRVAELFTANLEIRVIVGNHVRGVHAGEGFVLRILQQTAGTHRQRITGLLQERRELLVDRLGDFCFQKRPRDLLVVNVLGRQAAKFVLVHKRIEHVSAQRGTGRYDNVYVVEPLVEIVASHQGVDEGQPAPLAAHGAAADARERRRGVKDPGGKIGNHAALAPLAKLGDGVQQVLAHFVGGSEIGDFLRTNPRRQFELRAGHEPVAEMIVQGMKRQRLVRRLLDHGLERSQVVRAADDRAVRKGEDKISESQAAQQETAQVLQQRRRFFVDEARVQMFGALGMGPI